MIGNAGLSWIETALIQKTHQLNQSIALARELEHMKFRTTEPTFWRGKERAAGEVIEDIVGPYRHAPGAGGLVHTAQFEQLAEERRATLSAIDRIKAKALQARGIAPKAIADFEADLDGLIAEGPKLESARNAAVGMHTEAFKGIRGEIDGLKGAIDILSNGAPDGPLPESETK